MAKRTRRIQRIAARLLQQVGIMTPSELNVLKIAEMLGVQLRYFDDLEDISGLLYREDNQVIIGVKQTDPEERKRFTIAHELGHLQLHSHNTLYIDKVFPIKLRDKSSAEGKYLEEIEANAFAAELLMPEFMLEKEDILQSRVIDYEEDKAIRELAQKYRVSQQAMTFRLINLGFLPENHF